MNSQMQSETITQFAHLGKPERKREDWRGCIDLSIHVTPMKASMEIIICIFIPDTFSHAHDQLFIRIIIYVLTAVTVFLFVLFFFGVGVIGRILGVNENRMEGFIPIGIWRQWSSLLNDGTSEIRSQKGRMEERAMKRMRVAPAPIQLRDAVMSWMMRFFCGLINILRIVVF